MLVRKGHYVWLDGLLLSALFVTLGARAQRSSPSCQLISFKVVLNANDNYERELGGGLLFRIRSEKGSGWFVDIVPAEESTKDYIYPVNLPLQLNPNQTLGAGNGETVKSSLSHAHDMNFILDRRDYERISALVPRVLSDPDRVLPEYTNAADNARKGSVHVAIASYKADPKTGALTHIKLRVGITTPPDFQLAPGLYPWPAPCPR